MKRQSQQIAKAIDDIPNGSKANAMKARAELVEKPIINLISERANRAGIIMHPHPTRDIGVQILDLDIVGLPAIEFDRFGGRPVASINIGDGAFEEVRSLSGVEDAFGRHLGQSAGGEDDSGFVVLKHSVDSHEPPMLVEEIGDPGC